MKNNTKRIKYISIPELARELGISRVAVFKKVKKGEIPAEKIGRAYAVPFDYVEDIRSGNTPFVLTEEKKEEIKKTVARVVKEYGETLRLLGKE